MYTQLYVRISPYLKNFQEYLNDIYDANFFLCTSIPTLQTAYYLTVYINICRSPDFNCNFLKGIFKEFIISFTIIVHRVSVSVQGGSSSPIALQQVTFDGLFPSQENSLSVRVRVSQCEYFSSSFSQTMDGWITYVIQFTKCDVHNTSLFFF